MKKDPTPNYLISSMEGLYTQYFFTSGISLLNLHKHIKYFPHTISKFKAGISSNLPNKTSFTPLISKLYPHDVVIYAHHVFKYTCLNSVVSLRTTGRPVGNMRHFFQSTFHQLL